MGNNSTTDSGQMNEIMSENAWLNEKMEVLQNEIKRKTQEVNRLKKR